MITKEPKNVTHCAEPINFTRSARDGLRAILRALNLSSDEKLAIPAYIGFSKFEGSGVFDPIVESKTTYVFYPVTKNLFVDLPSLRALLEQRAVRAVLVIHYFGFQDPNLHEIRYLCDKYEVYLIEDCAHCMNTIPGIETSGTVGDYAIFSIHKLYPTTNGGFFRINRAGLPAPILLSSERIELSDLENFARRQPEIIAQTRRNNYQFVLERFQKTSNFEVLRPNLTNDVVPLNFPLLLPLGKRESIYFALQKQGIATTALYHTLISAMPAAQFPEAAEISSRILNLPIHQEIDIPNLRVITEALKKLLS